MIFRHSGIQPAQFLLDHMDLLLQKTAPGPVLDLACGDCSNGIFLAQHGLQVVCCDRSRRALNQAKQIAAAAGVSIQDWQVDLEREGVNPLPQDAYGAVLIFRYLHRPLIPCIKKAMRGSGLLIYETFTVEQRRFGKPSNPDFLLNPGELLQMFQDWDVIHSFEGIAESPRRAVARLVGRKPAARRQAVSRRRERRECGIRNEECLKQASL